MRFKLKVRRKIGGTLWENNKSVAVFANENYVGTDSDLSAFITKCYRFSTVRNFEKAGIENLIDIFKKSAEMGVRVLKINPSTSKL